MQLRPVQQPGAWGRQARWWNNLDGYPEEHARKSDQDGKTTAESELTKQPQRGIAKLKNCGVDDAREAELDEASWKQRQFTIIYSNVTLLGKKALGLLDDMKKGKVVPPHMLVWVECHLMGEHLNAIRRTLRKLGWKSMATPARPKSAMQLSPEEQLPHQLHFDPQESSLDSLAKYHNNGGDLIEAVCADSWVSSA